MDNNQETISKELFKLRVKLEEFHLENVNDHLFSSKELRIHCQTIDEVKKLEKHKGLNSEKTIYHDLSSLQIYYLETQDEEDNKFKNEYYEKVAVLIDKTLDKMNRIIKK